MVKNGHEVDVAFENRAQTTLTSVGKLRKKGKAEKRPRCSWRREQLDLWRWEIVGELSWLMQGIQLKQNESKSLWEDEVQEQEQL